MSRDFQFWLLQFIGWVGHSLISFVSLDLWYNEASAQIITHNIIQSTLGAFLSWPLRSLYTNAWKESFVWRITQAVMAILLMALVWSVLRIEIFIWMTGQHGLWQEFGGWYFSAIFVFAVWSALYFGIKYYILFQSEHSRLLKLQFEREEEKNRRLEAESLAQVAELKMLRYQLNPHFLFNTLNSVIALVSMNENDKASMMLIRLSQFMRYSLDKSKDLWVDLADEFVAIGVYLKIEEVRFPDRLKVLINVQEGISDLQIPGLILQPLVENAIKYGIAVSEHGGVISMSAHTLNDRLIIEVTDEIEGSDLPLYDEKSEGFGIGLKNTQQRLNSLFNGDFELNIDVVQNVSATVKINIPIIRGKQHEN